MFPKFNQDPSTFSRAGLCYFYYYYYCSLTASVPVESYVVRNAPIVTGRGYDIRQQLLGTSEHSLLPSRVPKLLRCCCFDCGAVVWLVPGCLHLRSELSGALPPLPADLLSQSIPSLLYLPLSIIFAPGQTSSRRSR